MASAADEASELLEIVSDADVVRVRQAVRSYAVDTKLSLVDQTKLVTAASELARNTLVHGGGGTAEIQRVTELARLGVRVSFVEHEIGRASCRERV